MRVNLFMKKWCPNKSTFTSNKNVPLMIFTGAGMKFGHIKQPALFMNIMNFIICCKSYKNIALLEKK